MIPKHSHLDVDFGATEPACLAQAWGSSVHVPCHGFRPWSDGLAVSPRLKELLARVELPDVDLVLNHGDLPLLRQ